MEELQYTNKKYIYIRLQEQEQTITSLKESLEFKDNEKAVLESRIRRMSIAAESLDYRLA